MKRLGKYDAFEISTADILCDGDFNCRHECTPQSVKDLADSIALHGLQFPIVVQPFHKQGFKYRIVAGHRRFMAVKTFLKWAAVPATIRRRLSMRQAQLLNFTENLERQDLNMLEEARALRKLYPRGVSLRRAAKELKRPTRWIHIRLRLLKLPEQVQVKAATGLLSAVNVEALLTLSSAEEQVRAAEAICKAKENGRTKALTFLDEKWNRTFKPKKSKHAMVVMIAKMLDANIIGLGPRALAWAAGYIRDDELLGDIRQLSATRDGPPDGA